MVEAELSFTESLQDIMQVGSPDVYAALVPQFLLLSDLCSLPSAEVTAPLTLCEPSRGCTGISQGGGFAQHR